MKEGDQAFEDLLVTQARRSGVALPEHTVQALGAHFRALVRWNRTHNLTRLVQAQAAVGAHYLDCLVPLQALQTPDVFVDVGSGAGFPGLVAALAWPGAKGVLVEPAAKRASFLVLAAASMGIDAGRLSVVSGSNGEATQGAVVLSRATFSPGRRKELTRYCRNGGEIVVWGHHHDVATWETEVSTWGFKAHTPVSYQVHGLEERCLLRARPLDQP